MTHSEEHCQSTEVSSRKNRLIGFADNKLKIIRVTVFYVLEKPSNSIMFGYKMAPKAYVLKAWCPDPASGATGGDSVVKTLTPSAS